jgi:2-polyprenyl-3-methyl-5-hydroxy-6-metoxy-1,4-benzoquinol methylase
MNARIDAALARGDATGWFEELYATARGEDDVPWADREPNAQLVTWLEGARPPAEGRRALVVGAGLGDDAEALAAYGFATTAFDISPTAVAWARRRFPDSQVEYRQADALAPPDEWRGAFDLVFEAFTLQSLPAELRPDVARSIAGFLAPGGTLLLVATARSLSEVRPGPPWPLAAEEVRDLFAGLEVIDLEDRGPDDLVPARRLRVEFRAPGG